MVLENKAMQFYKEVGLLLRISKILGFNLGTEIDNSALGFREFCQSFHANIRILK
jgi:hypothetical protein